LIGAGFVAGFVLGDAVGAGLEGILCLTLLG
jgi:hypothetical protein